MLKQRQIYLLSIILSLVFMLYGCEFRQKEMSDTPAALQTEFAFLYFSDTQADPSTGDYLPTGEIIAQAVAHEQNLRLAVFGGDTVNDGKDTAEWQNFWQAAGPALNGFTTAAVAGNHDNHALLTEQFDYPNTAPTGQDGGFFYSFGMGGIHFVMLDSNIMGAARQTDIDWLRDDLSSETALQATWRIVVMHHPMWPVTENPKDANRAETMRRHFLPVLEEYGVDLILCGHQHVYARSTAMNATSADGIVQIMVASGGKQSYGIGDFEYIASSYEVQSYSLIEATDKTLTVTAYNNRNQPIDKYTMQRE